MRQERRGTRMKKSRNWSQATEWIAREILHKGGDKAGEVAIKQRRKGNFRRE